ncbi:MAG: ComEA family DNA-binding protein [Halomonas sp.]|uniref:ComEA family DNA-binding protein n=1 Tax=Billgrantia antri TaxID=2846777 RepID=A0ABS6ZQE2_9GAMM|nr:ComEA family DNA-binding protein [Halomonas antri]MBW6391250.1 ComEA family DNA-binding protein [Halomonas antri]MDX5376418.1 ComEA family DNA-binding protein [Halomonas sp.]
MKGVVQAALLALTLSFATLAMAQDVAPINVNTADAELLAELPGIGPSRAQAIIEDREANGNFESADDLTRVSGIGSATVDGFRDQVEF